jgi:hypothetical protein
VKAALVLGGAGNVWEDLDAALGLGEFDGVIACNDVGAAYPGDLDAWVSLHAEKFGIWTAQRVAAGNSWPKAILAHAQANKGLPPCVTGRTDFRFPGQPTTGSSGLFALKVALIDLGFDRAVLCGVPMAAAAGHFFDLAAWTAVTSHMQGWKEALPHIKNRARSMSGWTRDLLGAPDEEWLGQ